jgi:hypothetical protein
MSGRIQASLCKFDSQSCDIFQAFQTFFSGKRKTIRAQVVEEAL